MSTVTFEIYECGNLIHMATRKVQAKVFLDGKRVGTIRDVKGGWQYFPKGSKVGGEIMGSIGLVQRSLKSEVSNG